MLSHLCFTDSQIRPLSNPTSNRIGQTIDRLGLACGHGKWAANDILTADESVENGGDGEKAWCREGERCRDVELTLDLTTSAHPTSPLSNICPILAIVIVMIVMMIMSRWHLPKWAMMPLIHSVKPLCLVWIAILTMLIKEGAYLVWIAVMTTVIKDDDDGF